MDVAHTKLEQCLQELGEHFDSVLILTTQVEEGRTRAACKRIGNYYACKGLAQEFLEDETQKDLAFHIAVKLKPNDE